ncbi:MAG: ABC transporter ATP-binding protein [Acidobacteria bacterium]|nr:ABC transporter ATP-binding protein [Acidobacteriota bacterium]MCA1610294.1 ABC transporter ATP-binding protein [Acidobacteriota bacterium]
MSTPAPSARDRGAALPGGETVVQFLDVWKRYGAREILAGVNLSVFRGEVLCILGPSGTGKSVALRHINGLTKPDSGDVRVFGESVVPLSEEALSPIRRRLAMLFQGGALFDSMNVEQNIAFPLKEHTQKTPKEIAELVAEKLQLVGLPGTQKKMPSELSGGMKKRIALARSIALEPEIILYDEPTTGLDPLTSEKIAQLIVDINLRIRTTSVVVTHDIVAARTVADRLAFLHQGRFQFVGTFDEAARGAHPVLSEYFRSMGFPCGTGAFPAVGGGT